jgi:hypothetical protein
MHSTNVALAVFACTFGGALLGMFLGPRLPAAHLSRDTQKAVKLGMGMIATLSGLVLGLLVSTAKSAFDTTDTEVKEISAKLVFLDHLLARYGPETTPIRAELRHYVALKIDQIWSPSAGRETRPTQTAAGSLLDNALGPLVALSPATDAQRELKTRALTLAGDIAQARWLLIEQNVGSVIPMPFLIIVVFWLTILFISFGLFSPRNATTIAALFVCALSVATALYLVLELSRPLGGTIQISSAAARNALSQMAR